MNVLATVITSIKLTTKQTFKICPSLSMWPCLSRFTLLEQHCSSLIWSQSMMCTENHAIQSYTVYNLGWIPLELDKH